MSKVITVDEEVEQMASFIPRTTLALVVIAVWISEAESGSPTDVPASFQEWLRRLKALINVDVDCYFLKGPNNVKLAESAETTWYGAASSSKNWRNYS